MADEGIFPTSCSMQRCEAPRVYEFADTTPTTVFMQLRVITAAGCVCKDPLSERWKQSGNTVTRTLKGGWGGASTSRQKSARAFLPLNRVELLSSNQHGTHLISVKIHLNKRRALGESLLKPSYHVKGHPIMFYRHFYYFLFNSFLLS